MICPRCDSEIKYGIAVCPFCDLRFKYKEDKSVKSTCRRSTACMLAFVLGAFGAHNFYLGHFWRGILRIVIFIIFCGSFVVPQAGSLISSGTFSLGWNYLTVQGLASLVLFVASCWHARIEYVRLMLKLVTTDASGKELM